MSDSSVSIVTVVGVGELRTGARNLPEICALLGHYAALSSSSVPIFKGQDLDFLTLEDGSDWLARNICKGLPFDAA
jgi:hypothetical protein